MGCTTCNTPTIGFVPGFSWTPGPCISSLFAAIKLFGYHCIATRTIRELCNLRRSFTCRSLNVNLSKNCVVTVENQQFAHDFEFYFIPTQWILSRVYIRTNTVKELLMLCVLQICNVIKHKQFKTLIWAKPVATAQSNCSPLQPAQKPHIHGPLWVTSLQQSPESLAGQFFTQIAISVLIPTKTAVGELGTVANTICNAHTGLSKWLHWLSISQVRITVKYIMDMTSWWNSPSELLEWVYQLREFTHK